MGITRAELTSSASTRRAYELEEWARTNLDEPGNDTNPYGDLDATNVQRIDLQYRAGRAEASASDGDNLD